MSRKEFRSAFVLFKSLRNAQGFGSFNIKSKEELMKDVDSIFKSTDADENGEITMSGLMKYLNHKFSKKAIDRIFKILDVNNDGKISRKELQDAFIRYSALQIPMMYNSTRSIAPMPC